MRKRSNQQAINNLPGCLALRSTTRAPLSDFQARLLSKPTSRLILVLSLFDARHRTSQGLLTLTTGCTSLKLVLTCNCRSSYRRHPKTLHSRLLLLFHLIVALAGDTTTCSPKAHSPCLSKLGQHAVSRILKVQAFVERHRCCNFPFEGLEIASKCQRPPWCQRPSP